MNEQSFELNNEGVELDSKVTARAATGILGRGEPSTVCINHF